MLKRTTRPADNFEMLSWFFMRVSGALIIILVLVHLTYVHFVHGVGKVNASFVAERWSSPTWLTLDFAMLVLALAHGSNGMRILIDDYIRPRGWRTLALTVLCVAAFVLAVVGGLVMLTFRGR